MKIKITVESKSAEAELYDTPTARRIFENLPFEGSANRWGEEIYFEIPVSIDSEPEARQEVAVGELGYWPMGSAFCVFFGPTPVSTDDQPKAYSPVNVFGEVVRGIDLFNSVSDGETVSVTAL